MIIGVTGSLGTGKSTVARMLAKRGAKVLDADKIGHQALRKNSGTYKGIVRHFGGGILNANKAINKKKLAATVFADRKKLKQLTDIIHPFVTDKIVEYLKQRNPKDIIIIDAPLLIEAKLIDLLDKLVVVKASRGVQLYRCMKGKQIKRGEALSRIKNQMPLSKKIKMADFVIDNNDTMKETRKQVDQIWREIKWT